MDKINIAEKLSQVHDYWNPRIAAELNGQHVKLAKLKGSFPWHHHENEDEMFLVISGKLIIEFRDKIVELNQHEFIVVPKGTEHRPVAQEEVCVMLFEPVSTLNTGNIQNRFTRNNLEEI